MNSSVGARRKNMPPMGIWILALWIISAAARFLLSVLMTQNPIIMPDESLYINLSRSLSNGLVSLRGQPLSYDSLLYPALLSIIARLPAPADLYRAMQAFNAALISLSVVPVFFIARGMSASNKTALTVAALTALMPDFAISEMIMADSLCYPLALTVFLFIQRALKNESPMRDTILAALLSGALYMAKPGYLALGIAFVLFLFFLSAKKTPGAIEKGLIALGILLAMVGLNRLIAGMLGVDSQYQSIYQRQTSAFSFAAVLQMLQGSLLYLYFIPAALLIFPLVLPLSYSDALGEDRALIKVLELGMLLMILGTCYIVYIDEYTGTPYAARIHLRYFSAFSPVLLAATLSPRLNRVRLNRRAVRMLCILIAMTVAFTPKALLSGTSYSVDALALASLTVDWPLTDNKTLFMLGSVGLMLFGGYELFRNGFTNKFRRGLVALVAGFMLVNNIAGYEQMRHNEDPVWAADALQAAEWTDGHTALFVATDGGYFWNPATALEARTRDAFYAVELSDLIANTAAGGVFQPFEPRSYWTEYAQQDLPTPEYLVMDSNLLYAIALDAGASSFTSENQKYAFVVLPENGKWLHSALSGLNAGWVQAGARLTVFDSALCTQTSLKVQLQAYGASEGGALTLTVNGQDQTFYPGTQAEWISAEFSIPGDGQPVTVSLSNAYQAIYVSSYLVGE